MNKKLQHLAAAAALAFAGFTADGANAATVIVDVTGAQSINPLGEAGNVVRFVDIGANALLTSLDWTVTLQAVAPSALSEMWVSFGRSDGVNMISFSPDIIDGFSGAGSYTGTLDLTGLGVGAGADGLLRVEFNEEFKDFAAGVAEGQWVSGSLTFGVSAVPEPASITMTLLGLGFLGARARRRG